MQLRQAPAQVLARFFLGLDLLLELLGFSLHGPIDVRRYKRQVVIIGSAARIKDPNHLAHLPESFVLERRVARYQGRRVQPMRYYKEFPNSGSF